MFTILFAFLHHYNRDVLLARVLACGKLLGCWLAKKTCFGVWGQLNCLLPRVITFLISHEHNLLHREEKGRRNIEIKIKISYLNCHDIIDIWILNHLTVKRNEFIAGGYAREKKIMIFLCSDRSRLTWSKYSLVMFWTYLIYC